MVTWFLANWQWCLLGLYIAEKVVKLTPFRWDDILIDGIREILDRLAGRIVI